VLYPPKLYLSLQKKLNSILIQLTVQSINGEFQEFPPTIDFSCNKIIPIGTQVIRNYDENYDIVAKRLFLFNYQGQVFGSFQFSSVADFVNKIAILCKCCSGCDSYIVQINGCNFTINGCQLSFGKKCDVSYLGANGCTVTINNCNLKLY